MGAQNTFFATTLQPKGKLNGLGLYLRTETR